MSYHLSGSISALFFLLTLSGLWLQIALIRKRKSQYQLGELGEERPTAVISILRFAVAFLAFYCFFLYGFSLERFNHYLVWPRLLAVLLVLIILFEVYVDRRTWESLFVFSVSMVILVVSLLVLCFARQIAIDYVNVSSFVVVVVTILFSIGAAHQILEIRKARKIGGLSKRMFQLFLLKDLSTIVFSIAMGLTAGWPILLLSAVSLFFQSLTLWHFRWVAKQTTP